MDYQVISAFLVLLNPFALFLYLKGIMETLNAKDFIQVLVKASIISFIIYLIFAVFGETIFVDIFSIHFDSFRIFGGFVIFYLSFTFVVKGGKSMIRLKDNLDDTASEIAMPFMVGAGSISLCILLGHNQNVIFSALHIAIPLILNFLTIVSLKYLRSFIVEKLAQSAFDKYMSIMVRVMGFLIGGVGVDMMFQGITNLLKTA
ncbi:MAG: MarC family protein [Bacteroidia bacterium]|nr:MarC family protein [Bacteroidia bacterium]MDW8157504.1 MarC family protein [Bacteroidia bacterium]